MQQEFDAVAREYDSTFSQTAVGSLLRARVRACFGHIKTLQNKVGTALEINCGTGEDAIWLAQQGWKVIATDASPEMIAVAMAKIETSGLSGQAQARICSFADLPQLPESNFDLIFSNFGGLNCISPSELEALGPVILQKLKPGGRLIAVVMSRFCWWEILYFLWKGNSKEAFRRFDEKPENAALDPQTRVKTWYYAPNELEKRLRCHSNASSGKFKKSDLQPIGLWLPPSYLNPFFEKRPRLLKRLNDWEQKRSPSWLAFAGDHFLICLEKEA